MATSANANININAVDNTRAAFLGVQRNLQGVQRSLQLNNQGIAMLARRYLSLAAVAGAATRSIRQVMTATESIKGLSPSAAASLELFRRDFEKAFGDMDNAAEKTTAHVLGFIGQLNREMSAPPGFNLERFFGTTTPGKIINFTKALLSQERAAERAAEATEGYDLVLKRILAGPGVERATQEVDAAMKAATKNLVELQRMGVELQSSMVVAEAALGFKENITAIQLLDKELSTVRTTIQELRKTQITDTTDLLKFENDLIAAYAREKEIIEQINKISGDAIQQKKEAGRVAEEAAKILSEGFEEAIFSGKKLSDVIKQLAIDLVRLAFRQAITNPLAASLGGFIKNIFPPRAMGGPVSSGSSYLVGERGPEIFTPSSAGNIISNQKSMSGGRGGSTYYIDARGADQTGLARLEAMIRQTQAAIVPMALGAMQDARNRGSAFAV